MPQRSARLELSLGVVIVEAKPQSPAYKPVDDSELEKLKAGGKPVELDESCRIFELLFERQQMVLYTVLNESYGVYPQEPEKFTGKLFRSFSWSHLLEFTKRTSIASEFYPGPLKHYQVACLNHILDVIATARPRIAAGYLGP